jgi:hypothetical protein
MAQLRSLRSLRAKSKGVARCRLPEVGGTGYKAMATKGGLHRICRIRFRGAQLTGSGLHTTNEITGCANVQAFTATRLKERSD